MNGSASGSTHPSNMTTRREGSRPELEDERPWLSAIWCLEVADVGALRVEFGMALALLDELRRLLGLLDGPGDSGLVLAMRAVRYE